jgi:hypothetical protein
MAKCFRKERIISTVSFPLLKLPTRGSAPTNLGEVRWFDLERLHAELYGFDRIGPDINYLKLVLHGSEGQKIFRDDQEFAEL